MTTPATERTKEVVEADLKQVQDDLGNLIKQINERWWREKWDENKINELEEAEKKLKEELKNLKEWVSLNPSEDGEDRVEHWEMTKESAMQYLQNAKDKSWSDLLQDSRNWIMAVQIVLKDKWYNVWKIDWILGRRTKAWVKEFQRKIWFTWRDIDWLPGPKTINAILQGWVEDWGDEGERDNGVITKTDNEWNTFTWTYKNGKPWNGTYKMKEGDEYTEYTVKDWKIE